MAGEAVIAGPQNEIEQLAGAIAALEAQRALLGDATVDALLGPARERLAALKAQQRAPEQRKQVTVLFADLAGFTALAEGLDPEDVGRIMDAYFKRVSAILARHGGLVEKFIGDAVMAVFGLPSAREDDAERAVRAGLAMQAALDELNLDLEHAYGLRLTLRVGINSGAVLASFLGRYKDEDFAVVGDTVNVASRLEQAAPPGSVLISHETYHNVRGRFDVTAWPDLAVKGRAEPVRAYAVVRARQRAFRMATRGVEGVDTRMIGRGAELRALQDAYRDVQAASRTQAVTLVGDAGVGKSRLLYEFEGWLASDAAGSTEPQVLHGRATPEMQGVPYSLLRDLFRERLDILDSDDVATVRAKFEAGVRPALDGERACLAGHLVGFDFSGASAVRHLLGNPNFGMQAQAYLVQYFRGVTGDRPTVVCLEDIHWADNSSLDFLARLVQELGERPCLVVCLARPALYERRPEWGAGVSQARLDLNPLSPDDSRGLVEEILRNVDELPGDLEELIVRSAEGNPFYVEELIRMLLEDGVIVRGEARWAVALERLRDVRVPSTLVGVLQARLDALPLEERELLQRASVVGRLFWDAAVAQLRAQDAPAIDVPAALGAAQARELIFAHERSTFAAAREYAFKHTLLRDVTYETVLHRLRRVYHAQVARWLESHGGGRTHEYAGLIAEHYERAGEHALAAAWLLRAGDQAYEMGAFPEAISAFGRALSLLPDTDRAGRAALLIRLGGAYERQGDYPPASEYLERGLVLARELGAEKMCADALSALSAVAHRRGAHDESRGLAEAALDAARAARDAVSTAQANQQLGTIALFDGDYATAIHYYTESLEQFFEGEHQPGIAACLNRLGLAYTYLGAYANALRHFEESVAISRTLGDQWCVTSCLTCMSWMELLRGDPAAAMRYGAEGVALLREIGDRAGLATCLNNLGHAAAALGDADAAERYYGEALDLAIAIGAPAMALETIAGLAGLWSRGAPPAAERAAELLGLVLAHPARDCDVDRVADIAHAALRAALPPADLEAALARGKDLDLAGTAGRLLASRQASRWQPPAPGQAATPAPAHG